MSKKDQLEQLILHYSGGSKVGFAKLLGISPQGLTSWLTRGSYDIERIYAKCVGVSAEWLLSGHGDMVVTDKTYCDRGVIKEITEGSEEKKYTSKYTPKYIPNSDFDGNPDLNQGCDITPPISDNNIHRNSGIGKTIDMQQIPLYELEATAGITSIFDKAINPINYISIPNLPKCDGAIHVRGNSMSPIMQSGDLVVFKMNSSLQYILWGDIYIVSFSLEGDDYTVVKMLQKSDKADHLKLVSYNPENEPMDIPMSTIRQLAHVKAWVHYNSMG